MASGPEHYREAERLLAAADRWGEPDFQGVVSRAFPKDTRDEMLAAAQVHATLAFAAARVDTADDSWSQMHSWREATR